MIKLIIIDFHGIISRGDYKNICRWLARRFHLPFDQVYEVFYHKYFSRAAVGEISEAESFRRAIKEMKLDIGWQEVRQKHLDFQILNKSARDYCVRLQKRGFTVLLLSKNTPPQFRYFLKSMDIKRFFQEIINTYDLRLPKASRVTIDYVLRKYKVEPKEVIMADDQEINLIAARKLGVKTIFYRNLRQFRCELERIIF